MENKKGLEIEIVGFPVKYITPPQPNKKDIFGSNLPAKKQKWVRPILPDDEEIKSYSTEDTIALIKREFVRRVEGFWFMNNGEPTYITGAHYFFLTHWYIAAETEDGYPEYRRAARFWFYVIDICDNDPLCAGAIMGCNKRFGKTEMALAHLYNRATLTIKNKLFGLNSLSAAEAKNNLFKERIIRSHKLIPNYLKPVSNETKSRREITAALTFRGNNLGGGKYSDALNNIIDHRPTLVSAYQGKKPAEILFDEMGSVTEISPKAWWRTVKQQLVVGNKVTGKCYLPTTLETMESIGAQEFKEIFRESDMSKRDANGRTQSYLYPYFKPHYLGREGFIDEYGNDLEEAAKRWRQNELDGADEVGKYTIKRQYPENEEEMFYVANDDSQLNMQNIEDQINFNEANPHLSAWGNLEWIDGIVDNPKGVRWVPTGSERTGKWNFMKLPQTPNMQIWKNGLRTPNNGDMGGNGVVGVDPTAGVRAYAKRQSDLAMFGWEFMRFGDPFSDCPIFDYCCRTPDPNAGFEDVIKTLVFLGMPAHIERNREALIKHIEMRGYNNYVLDRPAFSISEKSENKNDKGKGTPNTGAPFRNMLFTGLKGTIQNRCGFQTVVTDEGKDVREMSKWYLSRSLRHLKDFKPFEEWNDFDLAVAEMFAVILRIQYIVPKVKPREVFKINVPTYKNKLQG